MSDTITIRFPVAVTENGSWVVSGWTKPPDETQEGHNKELENSVLEGIDFSAPSVISWVTVQVPKPSTIEVKGKVE